MNSSYAYVYDEFLSDRRYERDLAALETKLNTYDLAGRIGRMTLFRSAKDLVEGLMSQGARTIVIVGNDGTLEKAMWFLPDFDITVGYIPLVGPSDIARLLAIPQGVGACDVLSARKIETLDVGRLDDRAFLTEVSLPSTTATLDVEGKYRISLVEGGSLTIRNLGSRPGASANPHDGFLEAIVSSAEPQTKKGMWSRPATRPITKIFFTSGQIISRDPVDAQVDHHAISGQHFSLRIEPQKLRCITGRSLLPTREKGGTFR